MPSSRKALASPMLAATPNWMIDSMPEAVLDRNAAASEDNANTSAPMIPASPTATAPRGGRPAASSSR